MKPAAAPRQRRLRQDSIRNQQELVVAVGELLREDPDSATMPAVAERAGLSLATAYRYFPTLDELHRKFMLSVIDELHESTKTLQSTGMDLFRGTMAQWLQVVAEYGPAMVLVRSREGFLTRLKAGEPHARALERVWGPPIRQLLEEANIDGNQLPYALSLFNAMFNSREIMDFRAVENIPDEQLVERCSRLYWSAIQGLRVSLD
ncbi:TetR/AcrR family transcriptional regulator [Arthrobacter sp. NPDC058097]|uniref:TetR/AcrR family transcriptional regulator n=1 Tax=Arthrobacter sp. NPDC058097 TaxID=3346340 RepID=UPI0036DEFCFF